VIGMIRHQNSAWERAATEALGPATTD
jgi:hypothetical protein